MRSREEHEKDTQKLSPAMFLATKYDIASEAWTRSSPTTAVSVPQLLYTCVKSLPVFYGILFTEA